jgi:hypothetical protein
MSEPEPTGAPPASVRFAPHALAAFVVSILGLMRSTGSLHLFSEVPLREIVRSMTSFAVLPVTCAVIALVLARASDAEIEGSSGRLVGSGFARGARLVAIATIAVVCIGMTLQLVIERERYQVFPVSTPVPLPTNVDAQFAPSEDAEGFVVVDSPDLPAP